MTLAASSATLQVLDRQLPMGRMEFPVSGLSAPNPLPGYELDAWHGSLTLKGLAKPAWAGVKVGEEFATSSVSSPGLESYVALPTPQVKAIFEGVVDDLKWIDPSRRGFLKMSFTATEAKGEWVFVDTISNRSYQASVGRTANYTG